ncbi:uncharacterized protein SCHCODRAFT_02643644 [Schizophyllum commune H4-8]|uniref:Expressed protein n=1 Tax=Schizophyllum commune (strain H4-8 / FGSC 9210) TaxID=578458 RepID=D8QJQ1_SCHCM|nr:uncharacterized protein SCHCODRAFT_02643644 [Schizophyllum commune H4-8]KAI5885503.1 hypothetical protein SCHCODRAFT_02643644 [Schizophyllum commune H4-8]
MAQPTDNPFAARLGPNAGRGVSITLRPPGQRRFFYATSASPSKSSRNARTTRPLPAGWRVSKYGYVLRPGEVDFFEEEDKAEEARRRAKERRLVRLAEAREQRARARDDNERQRLLDEHYPLPPAEAARYWEPGITEAEQHRRLANWRKRYFHIVVRFRCDPQLYDRYRHHYLPTEGLLDPIHDRAELDRLRRTLFTCGQSTTGLSRLARLRAESQSSSI